LQNAAKATFVQHEIFEKINSHVEERERWCGK